MDECDSVILRSLMDDARKLHLQMNGLAYLKSCGRRSDAIQQMQEIRTSIKVMVFSLDTIEGSL